MENINKAVIAYAYTRDTKANNPLQTISQLKKQKTKKQLKVQGNSVQLVINELLQSINISNAAEQDLTKMQLHHPLKKIRLFLHHVCQLMSQCR